jgi:hypothetical protein
MPMTKLFQEDHHINLENICFVYNNSVHGDNENFDVFLINIFDINLDFILEPSTNLRFSLIVNHNSE